MKIFSSKGKRHIKSKKINLLKNKWLMISIICATVAATAALWLLFSDGRNKHLSDDDNLQTSESFVLSQSTPTPTPTLTPTPTPPPASPDPLPQETPDPYDDGIKEADREIDFEAFSAKNADFFAWIYVPGTSIDYPVVKSRNNSDYLARDLDGRYFSAGTIFMDMSNNIDLSNRICVLYGHNMKDGTKFADLHNFRDPGFFAENREFKLYTPEGMRVYEIIAAYVRDDRNILYRVDYSTDDVWEAYIDEIFANTDAAANLFEIDVGNDDQMLTLSTCIQGQDTKRFLVQGILRRNLGG